jgi:hypothetical protein
MQKRVLQAVDFIEGKPGQKRVMALTLNRAIWGDLTGLKWAS